MEFNSKGKIQSGHSPPKEEKEEGGEEEEDLRSPLFCGIKAKVLGLACMAQ